MQTQIFKHPYQVRRAALHGKEITVPPEVPLKPVDTVIALYDGFILFVPKGTCVDETLLIKAIREEEQERGDER